jgi:hypothetical protein
MSQAKMARWSNAALVVTLNVLWASGQVLLQDKRSPTPGEWSANGVYLAYGLGSLDKPGKHRVSEVPSPDSAKVALFPDGQARLIVQDRSGRELAGTEGIGIPTLSEVLWSDDSAAFAVTSSEGGWVGQWSVLVFLVDEKLVKPICVTDQAKKDAMTRYKCNESERNEEPEMGAVAWLERSKRLLVVAQVPPHSSCYPHMGKLFGYVVSVPSGDILERYSEKQLRNRWRQFLGERLERRRNH